MAETAPGRQACRGSCHCGLTQYIVFLTLPHPFSSSHPPQRTQQDVYRCNRSTCYTMNIFHLHPANPQDDFMLLSPLDPDQELRTYKKRKSYFCPKCGGRCVTFGGVGETDVADVTEPGDKKEGKRKVGRAKWDGENDTRPYVSVNATAIDLREDFDLRVLTEEKRVQYFDDRGKPEEKKEARWDRPLYGGRYWPVESGSKVIDAVARKPRP